LWWHWEDEARIQNFEKESSASFVESVVVIGDVTCFKIDQSNRLALARADEIRFFCSNHHGRRRQPHATTSSRVPCTGFLRGMYVAPAVCSHLDPPPAWPGRYVVAMYNFHERIPSPTQTAPTQPWNARMPRAVLVFSSPPLGSSSSLFSQLEGADISCKASDLTPSSEQR
jgi:hypothetical protein